MYIWVKILSSRYIKHLIKNKVILYISLLLSIDLLWNISLKVLAFENKLNL